MRKDLTVGDVKRLVKQSKSGSKHWFSPDTMRFFKSRVPKDTTKLEGGEFFVSSEQYDYSSPRLFTIRRFEGKTKQIETVGEFQAFATSQKAKKAIKDILKKKKQVGKQHLYKFKGGGTERNVDVVANKLARMYGGRY